MEVPFVNIDAHGAAQKNDGDGAHQHHHGDDYENFEIATSWG